MALLRKYRDDNFPNNITWIAFRTSVKTKVRSKEKGSLQDQNTMEERYLERWEKQMMAHYRLDLKRDISDIVHDRILRKRVILLRRRSEERLKGREFLFRSTFNVIAKEKNIC